MKKLITIMASAAVALFAFGAFAATLDASTGTSFENYTGELKTDYTDDGESTSGDLYWYIDGKTENDEFTITNHLNGSGDFPTRPEMFSGANNNYLSIEAATNLYRTILGNSAGSDIKQVDIGNGIYLDTMVKFTAAESAFGESDIAAGDKLAISYVEHGEDALDPNNPDDFTFTNIVVRAGYVDGSTITPKNYRLNLPEDFVSTNWHRLTVRAISDVGYANAPVAFAVYVDTNLLTYAISEQAGTSAYETALAGNATVATYLYNSEKHALLPSLLSSSDDDYDALSAVGFKGNGCIDDVSFTASKPSFIVENTMVTIAWETGVTNYTVIANGSTPITNENVSADGEVLLTLDPSITTLTVEAQYDATHKPGKWIASNGAENLDGNVWTIEKDGKLTITSIVPKFQVGDKFFDKFGDALDEAAGSSAASRGTVVVLADYTGDLTVEGGFVTIDLAGKTITGVKDAAIYVETDANLIITNSTTKIGRVEAGTAEEAVYLAGGTTTIFGGWFDGEILDDGADGLFLYGGYYLDAGASGDPADFYLAKYAQDTVTYADNDYFQVGTAAPQPTTFALTTTGGANATVTTDPADVSALTEETEVTITATADEDYTYDGVDLTGTDWTYDSQTDAISMTTNVSENTTVVVPDAVSEQSQEDWPEGQDLIDAEGQAAGDLFHGITNALATADAKAVATWAEAKGVAYADKGGILPEAFLLDCANTQAAIDEAAANFKINAITIVGDTVTIDPADGAVYGNGQIVIEGATSLASPISWHEKAAGDHFFRATLVVKPVAVP